MMEESNQNNWEKTWENNFLEIYHSDILDMGLCVATQEYIPIAEFKVAFLEALELAKKMQWKGFVFDKSALTTFHQPSMEWYYTEWKTELLELGLSQHYKILPPIPWFKTSVDAGIEEIKSNHPDFDFSKINVTYIQSIEGLNS